MGQPGWDYRAIQRPEVWGEAGNWMNFSFMGGWMERVWVTLAVLRV